jgi:hypothetical protein
VRRDVPLVLLPLVIAQLTYGKEDPLMNYYHIWTYLIRVMGIVIAQLTYGKEGFGGLGIPGWGPWLICTLLTRTLSPEVP